MPDKETLFSVLIGAVILLVGIGLISSQQHIISTDSRILNDPSGFILSKFSKDEKVIKFDATLTFDSPQMISGVFISPVNVLTINYNEPNSDIFVNNLRLTSQKENTITVYGYKGDYTLNNIVSLRGNGESINMNGVTAIGERKVPIMTEGLVYNYVKLSSIPETSISLIGVSGTINMFGDVEDTTIKKKEGEFSLRNFQGDVELYPNKIILRGNATLKTKTIASLTD